MKKRVGRDIFYGGLAGATGAACMVPWRLLARRLGLVHKMVPQAIEEALAARVGLDQATPRELHHAMDQVLHLGFGASLGVLYALLTQRRRESAFSRGLVFGGAAYLLGSGVVIPALGAARPLWRARPREQLVNAAAHLVYGLVTALVADELFHQTRLSRARCEGCSRSADAAVTFWGQRARSLAHQRCAPQLRWKPHERSRDMAQPRTAVGPGRRSRIYRSGPQEREPDLQTAIEDEMAASGHHAVVPRTGVIGAHPERVTSATMPSLDDAMKLPPGVEVAPTRKALEHEQARHQAERASRAAEGVSEAAATPLPPPPPAWQETVAQKPTLLARVFARGQRALHAWQEVAGMAMNLARFGAHRGYELVRARLGRDKPA
jgi:hypothetical protein